MGPSIDVERWGFVSELFLPGSRPVLMGTYSYRGCRHFKSGYLTSSLPGWVHLGYNTSREYIAGPYSELTLLTARTIYILKRDLIAVTLLMKRALYHQAAMAGCSVETYSVSWFLIEHQPINRRSTPKCWEILWQWEEITNFQMIHTVYLWQKFF